MSRRSHFGCGALLGFCMGFLGMLKEPDTVGFIIPTLAGLGAAVLVGLLAALLGNRFWLRR